MSAQFKPGDRVRVIKAEGSDGNLAIGDEHVVKRVNSSGDVSWGGMVWARERFVKVEPEFTVGQQVSGDDYARLPVGSKVEYDMTGSVWTKVGEAANAWHSAVGTVWQGEEGPRNERTLTHLPDAAEPEDKDDLYVEPEPLKEGDAVLVWAKVVAGEPDADGAVSVELPYAPLDLVDADVPLNAIVRPDAGQVPPWVKPAEEPLNIGAVVADRDDAVWARVATGDPGGPWWTRASEGPEESMTYPHHWGDLAVREVLSEGYMDGGAS